MVLTHRLCIAVCVKEKTVPAVRSNLLRLWVREGEIRFKCAYRRCILTPGVNGIQINQSGDTPNMRNMLVPVGTEARVGEREDIEGSYPSFCYSAADPFSALVRKLAATSPEREESGE